VAGAALSVRAAAVPVHTGPVRQAIIGKAEEAGIFVPDSLLEVLEVFRVAAGSMPVLTDEAALHPTGLD
jgi:hypothetical protein